MSDEEQAKLPTIHLTPDISQGTDEEVSDGVRNADARTAELEQLEAEESTYRFADDFVRSDEDLNKLSDEELRQQVEFLAEQIDQAKKRIETNRRGLRLGYLKLANQARRCSHLRNDGEPCRAPAMGNREFCVFHSRGYDCETNQRIKFGFLEDDGNLQLVLKQIMEQLLSGRISPQTAALLLRGTQIANGVLKARKTTLQQRKPARSATQRGQRNAEEFAG